MCSQNQVSLRTVSFRAKTYPWSLFNQSSDSLQSSLIHQLPLFPSMAFPEDRYLTPWMLRTVARLLLQFGLSHDQQFIARSLHHKVRLEPWVSSLVLPSIYLLQSFLQSNWAWLWSIHRLSSLWRLSSSPLFVLDFSQWVPWQKFAVACLHPPYTLSTSIDPFLIALKWNPKHQMWARTTHVSESTTVFHWSLRNPN